MGTGGIGLNIELSSEQNCTIAEAPRSYKKMA